MYLKSANAIHPTTNNRFVFVNNIFSIICFASIFLGTVNPIWLEGDHPTDVDQMKTLKACVRIAADSCCANSWSVDVKKCAADERGKEYFVYKLEKVPGCPMSYCAGNT